MSFHINTAYYVIPRLLPIPVKEGRNLELHKVLKTINLLLRKFFKVNQKLELTDLERIFTNLGYDLKKNESGFVHTPSLGLIKLEYIKLNTKNFTFLKFIVGGYTPQNIGEEKLIAIEKMKDAILQLQKELKLI